MPGGAFSSVFVGAFGASAVLSRISSTRTEGSDITIKTESEYVVSTNTYELSGLTTISFSLKFYTDSGIAALLAKSVAIDGTLNDASDPTRKYVLLCINGDTTKQSYLFKEISVTPNLNPNYNKDKPTMITINFTASNIDPTYDLYKQGTPTELKAILGSRSPI